MPGGGGRRCDIDLGTITDLMLHSGKSQEELTDKGETTPNNTECVGVLHHAVQQSLSKPGQLWHAHLVRREGYVFSSEI